MSSSSSSNNNNKSTSKNDNENDNRDDNKESKNTSISTSSTSSSADDDDDCNEKKEIDPGITFLRNTTATGTAIAQQQQDGEEEEEDDDDDIPLMLSSSDYTSSTTTAAVVAAATIAAASRHGNNTRNEKRDIEQQHDEDHIMMYHPHNNRTRNAISCNAAIWDNLSFKEKDEFLSICSLQDIGFACCEENDDANNNDDTNTTHNPTNIAVAKRLVIRGIPVDQIGVRLLRKFVSANDIKMKTKRNRLELTNAIAQCAIALKEEQEKRARMQSCKRAKTSHKDVYNNRKNDNDNHHNVVVTSGGKRDFLDGSSNCMIPFNHEMVLDAIQCYKRDNTYTILDRLLQEILELEDEISDLEVCMDQFLKRGGNADSGNTTTTTTEERLEMMKLERKLKTWRERLHLKKSHKEQLQGDLAI